MEGSIPNEKIKAEGYWAAEGWDPATGQPITICEWLDKLAAAVRSRSDRRRHLRNVWRHPRDARQSDRRNGTCATTSAGTGIEGRASIVNVPGCPVQPDNFMETLLLSAVPARGSRADDSARRPRRPKWLFHRTVHDGCDRAGSFEQGIFRARIQQPELHREDRLPRAGRPVQRAQARLDGRNRRLPERRRHLHRLHDAGLSGQVHAFMDEPPAAVSRRTPSRLTRRGSCRCAS
jgi:hypothetical protein